jgi:hypothetical protein
MSAASFDHAVTSEAYVAARVLNGDVGRIGRLVQPTRVHSYGLINANARNTLPRRLRGSVFGIEVGRETPEQERERERDRRAIRLPDWSGSGLQNRRSQVRALSPLSAGRVKRPANCRYSRRCVDLLLAHRGAIEGSRERERERDASAYARVVASLPEGVRLRHRKACATRSSKRCSCEPYYEASVGLGLRGERRSKSFSTAREARDWRIGMLAASHRRRRLAASRDTLRDAAEAYVDGMRSGMIKNRSGDVYKPKVARDYESTLRL